jgi:hypothetical protein
LAGLVSVQIDMQPVVVCTLSRRQAILINRPHHRQDTGLHGNRQFWPSVVQQLEISIGYFIRGGFARTDCAGFCAALT